MSTRADASSAPCSPMHPLLLCTAQHAHARASTGSTAKRCASSDGGGCGDRFTQGTCKLNVSPCSAVAVARTAHHCMLSTQHPRRALCACHHATFRPRAHGAPLHALPSCSTPRPQPYMNCTCARKCPVRHCVHAQARAAPGQLARLVRHHTHADRFHRQSLREVGYGLRRSSTHARYVHVSPVAVLDGGPGAHAALLHTSSTHPHRAPCMPRDATVGARARGTPPITLPKCSHVPPVHPCFACWVGRACRSTHTCTGARPRVVEQHACYSTSAGGSAAQWKGSPLTLRTTALVIHVHSRTVRGCSVAVPGHLGRG